MAEKFKRIADADFAALAKYERELDHLIYGHFFVGVGNTALDWMQEWWQRYMGAAAPKVNKNCANCIADFLKGVGMAYFKEKGLRTEEAQEAAKAKAAEGQVAASVKAEPKHEVGATNAERKTARKVSTKKAE